MKKLRHGEISDFPKVTKLVSGRIGIQTQAVWIQGLHVQPKTSAVLSLGA